MPLQLGLPMLQSRYAPSLDEDSVHCCGPTEAVIRLVLSALVGVATVILLVYDIRSRRAEQHHARVP
ncbi:hypothetical protein QQF64_019853 [Cirrhinus molitorella]|uniref:Uncharacterized protein n=1 Tax=Cirrhinus molitorella TaxID=172907 RepID=A0ABR3LKA0_9TELE